MATVKTFCSNALPVYMISNHTNSIAVTVTAWHAEGNHSLCQIMTKHDDKPKTLLAMHVHNTCFTPGSCFSNHPTSQLLAAASDVTTAHFAAAGKAMGAKASPKAEIIGI